MPNMSLTKNPMPTQDAKVRAHNFNEVATGYSDETAIDEALRCRETGEEKNIVLGLTGTGYFDLTAYARFNNGEMSDLIPTDEALEESLSQLPDVSDAAF